MGGAPKPKKESNIERNARIASQKRGQSDADAVLRAFEARNARRRRSSLLVGPESTATPLGGYSSRLGAY